MKKEMSLEGLRGLACLNVAIGHFLFVFIPSTAADVRPYPGLAPHSFLEHMLMWPPFTFLYLADSAVLVFFALSGYVLTKRFYETRQVEDLRSAAARRFVRLVIPAFASVMLAWVLLQAGAFGTQLAGKIGVAGWILDLYTKKVGFLDAVGQGLIGAPLFGVTTMNGPLWSIQVELIGSILLFAIYAAFGKSKLQLIFWFTFFAFIFSHTSGIIYYMAILGGSLLHLIKGELVRRQRVSEVCVGVGLFLLSITHARVFHVLWAIPLPNLAPYGPDLRGAIDLLCRAVGAVFLVAGVIGSSVARDFFGRPFFVYLGKVSFAVYLLHFPLIMSLSLRVAQAGQAMGLPYWEYAALALVVTGPVLFFMAELFYRYVDQPAVKLAKTGLTLPLGRQRQTSTKAAA